MRLRWLPLLALLGCGCGKTFTPDSLVNSFRVLGVSADSPELHPGNTTPLHALVVDPTRPGQVNTLVWLGCDPDPLDLERSACTNLGDLQSAAALAADVDGGSFNLPAGMHLIGYNDSAAYSAPADTFSQIPVGDSRRLSGSIADMLIVAAAGELSPTASDAEKEAFFTQVEDALIPAVLVVDRVVISEQPVANANPAIGDVILDGNALPDGGSFRFLPGANVSMDVTAPASSFETFQEIQPDGTTVQQTEKLVAALYATTGNFSLDRIAVDSGTPLTFTAPAGTTDDPLPDKRTGAMWIVLRDTRGGESWAEYPIWVCDPTLIAPYVSALTPPSGPANGTTTLALQGQNLASVLDALVGGVALRDASFSQLQNQFVGTVPSMPSGSYPVTVRGKDCHDYDTGLSYQAQ